MQFILYAHSMPIVIAHKHTYVRAFRALYAYGTDFGVLSLLKSALDLVLQHRECKNRTSSCNQKSHIRKQSTHPLGNVRSWYSHSCHESATARKIQDTKAAPVQYTVASTQSNTQFPECISHEGAIRHSSSRRRHCCELVDQLHSQLTYSPECFHRC